MKFNQKLQYGILLGLYLTRAGRATVGVIAEELNLSKSLLEQVAAKLSSEGIVKSVKGPGGGYELGNNVTLCDLVDALQPFVIYQAHEQSVEGRTLQRMMVEVQKQLIRSLLSVHLREYMQEVVTEEVELLNTLDKEGVLNQ